jgi:nicotinate phosphoribosyltransferase
MSLISELYFSTIENEWEWDAADYANRTHDKFGKLSSGSCRTAEFGTRRRACFESQNTVVAVGTGNFEDQFGPYGYFTGTSNVYLAREHGTKPIGTVAHEWFQAVSALESLRHANRFAMDRWAEVYDGNLGIALTDTFGTDAFFRDFDLRRAKLWDGLRHDSGDGFDFAQKSVSHYIGLGIDPRSKTIVFSDSLDDELAVRLAHHCRREVNDPRTGNLTPIQSAFGIGTFFTNDIPNVTPLNIVIKLISINGIDVVKLSDDRGKEIGEDEALAVAKYTFFNTPLRDTID